MSNPEPPKPTFFSAIAWKQRVVFWLGAVLVGLLVVVVTLLSEWASMSFKHVISLAPWAIFFVAPVGMAITTWLCFRYFPGSERSGIPQVKSALEIHGHLEQRIRLLSFRIAVGKIMLPIMGILSGASVGLGGPSVQIGASIMASLGRAVRFPPHYLERGLILAGSAAGFAAMFSAPLAGIVFAIEEMGRALEEKISSLVLTAIIFAGMTAYALLNSYIFFDDTSVVMPWDQSWLAVPLCGTAGGILGAVFSRTLIVGGRYLKRKGPPIVAVALLSGFVIAVLGYASGGDTYGTGFQKAQIILTGAQEVDPLYPFLKMLATCATFFSGIPSGIFVPALATGAGLGSDLAHLFPVAPVTAMILLTMSGYFAGMLQSPITAFVIVMEMTNTHDILIPLMATAFLASGTSKLFCPTPLYRALCDDYDKEDTRQPSATVSQTAQ